MKYMNRIGHTTGNELRSVTGFKLDHAKRFNKEFDGMKVDFAYEGKLGRVSR